MFGRRWIALPLVLALLVGATGLSWAAPSSGAFAALAARRDKLDPQLLRKFTEKAVQEFVVEFAAKADLEGARRINGFGRRGQVVREALVTTANRSQAGARRLVAASRGATATSYWITNVLVVRGDARLAQSLADLPEVTRVRPVKVYPLVQPVESRPAILAPGGDPEWGVAKIGADRVWDTGIVGQGIVVANLDTGVDFLHPALVNQYRGNDGDGTFTHDYNWWDPTGICGDEPCDNVFHGTHTMGSIVGGDGPGPFAPDIGVAPGSRWIAAKGCEEFGCTETSLLSGGQFLLAPTDLDGNNPDPSRRPDVINNSWGSDDPGDTFFLGMVEAWRAAGIIPVFSNGNAGEFGCGTSGTPANFPEVLGIGATDIDDEIAFFSSRGPAPSGLIKPDVSAPGVDVVSSVPGDGYEAFSGTSMAAPHATGAIALMLSAELGLVGQFNTVADALKVTAVDRIDTSCGGDEDGDPNNVFGEGRIDALAAVGLVRSGGTLAGTVRDAADGAPVAGARVTADNGERQFSTVTDASGRYELFLAAGSYTVTAEAFGYESRVAVGVVITTDATTTRPFRLTPLPRFTIRGVVRAAENGAPIRNVKVQAIGTPVPPVFTDADGTYALTLPSGTHTIQAAAGGCTETGLKRVTLVDADISRNFTLFRKLDDFGHGCRPIEFNWVDAPFQTGLVGDEVAGRLALPFDFPFYGDTYRQVFISDNGYVNFLGADRFNPTPVAIPSASTPNAAIYALWQDLRIGGGGTIDYKPVGTAPNRVFVIEFSNVKAAGASEPIDIEVKLWENGTIDLLYGDNPANPGDGRNALVGIENSEGTDALQFSFLEALLGPNEAYRFEPVPTGLVHGRVTDANDGLAIEGAVVTAQPGGRSAQTDAGGRYSLVLRPGSYTLTADSEPYTSRTREVRIAEGGDVTASFDLRAAVAEVAPTEVASSVALGKTTEATVTLANTGSATLLWTARERDLGVRPPTLPPIDAGILRRPVWGPSKVPAGVPTATIPQSIAPEQLTTIIDDPVGDAVGPVDITTVRGGSDGTSLASLAIDFSGDTPMDQVAGFVLFDTDQDPSTGFPPEELFGKPTQDIGVDFFADMFAISEGIVFIVDGETFELVAEVPATVEGQTVSFDVPLEAFGGDDGAIDVAMVLGDFEQPTDWAPDVGHGTIEPFTDAPWLGETPESGTVAVGAQQDVTLTLGGPEFGPGRYHALLVLVTNAPKQPQLDVDVTLRVRLPVEFGALEGVVTDAHDDEPIQGVAVALEAEWRGEPYPVTTETDVGGAFQLFAPAGAWPITYSADGFVTASHEATITAGGTTSGADAALHRVQPHAELSGGPFEFFLTPGHRASGRLILSNPLGHSRLDFSVGEIDLSGRAVVGTAAAAGTGTWLTRADRGVKMRRNGGGTGLAHPSAFRWEAALPAADLNVLVYADDAVHTAPDTFLDQALHRLGMSYTAHYDGDWEGFQADLEAGGWDLVLVANDNFFPDTSVLDALHAYVVGGGLLVFHGWTISDDPSHPLWEALGFSWVADDGDPPDPVYWWQPAHAAFNVPERVPELTSLDGEIYGTYGQHVEPNSEGEAIAGYTTRPDPEEAALIVGASRRTVFKGFLDGQNSADLDADGALDGVELWTNLIVGIQAGFVSEVPWLSVEPIEGTVRRGESAVLRVTADSTGLAPGRYQAAVAVLTNDPDHRSFLVPVDLIVPGLQRGVNAGNGAYTDEAGSDYAADRRYGAGPFGYVGDSSTASTGRAIDGTRDDVLYQTQRIGMAAYRFDVPDGHYRVDLSFAELTLRTAGARVFIVLIEGEAVLVNFDVFAVAGRRWEAVDRSFEVDVTDGHLDVEFVRQAGERPIANAVLVSKVP